MSTGQEKILETDKQRVFDFWEDASCGESLYLKGDNLIEQFNNQLEIRYALEPFIIPFAEFDKCRGIKVLEIGVGLGADHQMFAKNGADLYGVDLTERAVNFTSKRMEVFNLKSTLSQSDAENLPFEENDFDFIYSWGVIHHSPNTQKAVDEIYRVLKPGGKAKIMIYHKYSMVGYMLWVRYALFTLHPLRSLNYIYSHYLESPGTKAYSFKEARRLFKAFDSVKLKSILGHGDLLTSNAGQRHKGKLLNLVRKIYPRFIIKTLCKKHGLFLLIDLTK